MSNVLMDKPALRAQTLKYVDRIFADTGSYTFSNVRANLLHRILDRVFDGLPHHYRYCYRVGVKEINRREKAQTRAHMLEAMGVNND